VTIPRVSPLRGGQPEGTLTILIGGPMAGRLPAVHRRQTSGAPGSTTSPTGVAPGAAVTTAASTTAPVRAAAPVAVDVGVGESPAALVPDPGPVPEPASLETLAAEVDDEPPLSEEAGIDVGRAATTTTAPLEAGPGQALHISFGPAPDERIVSAFTELRAIIRERPGGTPVVLHVPAGPGRTREMRLGSGIAYDAELVAEVGRRFGGLLRLQVA
jgi:hypothetical protein